MRGLEKGGWAWARNIYLGVLGAVLGLALVVTLTDDLGRRVCGGGAALPGAEILLGCGR